MSNTAQINGDSNIIIQQVTDSTITLQVNGEVQEIRNELVALRKLLEARPARTIQYADKIYNIEHIDEANFRVVTSKGVFNAVLTRELIEMLRERPKIALFLKSLPEEDQNHWECIRTHLREGQGLLEESMVWVIGWEMRRLFSIGNDWEKSMEVRTEEYIHHCFSLARLSFQLTNSLLLSKLWDIKKSRNDLPVTHQAVNRFFRTIRPLKLTELWQLLHHLLEIFRDNHVEFPFPEINPETHPALLELDSPFAVACKRIGELESHNEQNERYSLAHCHSAEIALATILRHFSFFTDYQLVSMKKVEYEQIRNAQPRYIKDFSILEKKETKALQRILKYDDNASLTYALFFAKERIAVNLFPFFLDYNSLTNEQDFNIYAYECREGTNGLRFFSLKTEKESAIYYKGVKAGTTLISTDEQKNEEQKNIRLDLVINQFEDAMNTILGTCEHFEASSAAKLPDL